MKYLNVILILILTITIIFSGCVSEKRQETIRVGVILSLTGTFASLGQDMIDAVLLAKEEINSNGGINGKQIELFIEDSPCEATKAVSAAEKLITFDQVVAIIGPTCSSESLAIAPLLTKYKIPAISPSATGISLTEGGGDYFFRVIPGDDLQAKVGSKYAITELNAKTMSIIYLQNDYGLELQDAMKKRFSELGGKIVSLQSVETGVRDARQQILKIKESNPDIVYIICNPEECSVILKQIKEIGANFKLLAADGANDPKVYLELGSSINGFTTTIASGATNNFPQKYKAIFKKDAGAYTGQSYDAMNVLYFAIKKSIINNSNIKDELYNTDYNGSIGNIRFDEYGDLITAKYDLFSWYNNEFKLIKSVDVK